MKFKNLTDKDKEYIYKIYISKENSWDERMGILMTYTGKSERTIRRWLVKLGFKEKNDIEPEQYEKAKTKKLDYNKKRFIITWAQNNTSIHKKFFDNIKVYADYINADIHVIAGRYKNPTSVHTDIKYDYWGDKILPYLDANRHKIHDNLAILSDVKIQPTAVNPMTGMAAISGLDSCIFGSPKVHFDVIPALHGYNTKKMWTTGACTMRNYTDSKAGKKGSFHHIYGFVIVEVDNDNIFHVRQVTANDNGSFHDLFYYVKDCKVIKNKNIESIILGDIHLGSTDNDVLKETKTMLDYLPPKHMVIHDLFDGKSISHHDLNNPIKLYHKEINGLNGLQNEINDMVKWLKEMERYNLVIVRSNHDDFVDRWIINSDWKKDIKNSTLYMDYAKLLLENKAPKGIIPYIINQNSDNIITLDQDESFRVKDWEVGVHGDKGANGSRGSITNFRKLNTKMVIGHTHTPARKDGVLVVGTSTKLRLDYNKGASSWLNSHVIIHKDGKAQHINFLKDKKGNVKYTTLK